MPWASNEGMPQLVESNGTVSTWGQNGSGQLGLPGGNQPSAQQVPNLSGAVAVAGGHMHTLVLKSDGTVWAFGNNVNSAHGVLGSTSVVPVPAPSEPRRVEGLPPISAIAAGDNYSEAYRDSRRPHFLGGWGLWDVQVGSHRRCVSAPSGW